MNIIEFTIKTLKNGKWRTTHKNVDVDDSIDVRLFRSYCNQVLTFDKRIIIWREIHD